MATGLLYVNGVANPATPTLSSAATGGTIAAGTYYYDVAAIGQTGTYTVAEPATPTSVTTTGTTSINTISWTAVTNATGYIIYRSSDGGTTWYGNTVSSGTTSITDNGSTYTWGGTAVTPQTWNATGGIGLQQDTALVLDGGTGNYGAQLSYSSIYNSIVLGDYNTGGGVTLQGNSFNFEDTTGYTNDLQISSTGATIFQNRVNSTTAFQIQTAGATPVTVLNVDTTNDEVTINAGGVPLELNENTSTGEDGILFNANTVGNTGEIGIAGSTGHIINSSASTDLALKASNGNILFSASTNNSSNEQMRLTQNGNLGIGTQTPHVQLEVAGGTYLGTQTLTANDQSDVCLFGNSTCSAAQSGAYYNQLKVFGGSSQTRYLSLFQAASGDAYLDSNYGNLVLETTGNNANVMLEANGTGQVISDTIAAFNPSSPGVAETWHNITKPSGWTDHSTSGVDGFRYRLEPDGTVLFVIDLTAPSTAPANGTILGALPSAYIPKDTQHIALAASSNTGSGSQVPHIDIDASTGDIKCYGINASSVESAQGILVLN